MRVYQFRHLGMSCDACIVPLTVKRTTMLFCAGHEPAILKEKTRR